MSHLTDKKGFTFIEVLVAMLIFVLAVLAAINVVHGAVRATVDAKTRTTATWLLQNVMVELETKLDTLGIDKGCEKKREAKFDPPYERFSWVAYCYDIPINLSEAASAVLNSSDGKASDQTADVIQKTVLDIASDYMTKAVRELHVEVMWTQGKNKNVIDVTTHYARFDLPVQLPAMGAGAPK